MGIEISTYYNLLEPLGHVCKHLALPFYEKKMKLREKIYHLAKFSGPGIRRLGRDLSTGLSDSKA